jgi:hypothetical protein
LNTQKTYTEKTAAADKSIGFEYQYYYFLYRVLKLGVNQSVGLEVKDDVHTDLDNDHQILIQLKHTVQKKADNSPQNLSNFDSDLWKTLSNWSKVISDEEDGRKEIHNQLSFIKKTDFMLVTNKSYTSDCKFFSICENPYNARKELEKLKSETKSITIQEYIQNILKLVDDVLVTFIQHIVIETEINDVINLCKQAIIEHHIPSSSVEQLFRDLDSIIRQDNFIDIRAGKKIIISFDDFSKKYRRYFDIAHNTDSDWNSIEHATELAVAQLIGSWNEHNTHDFEVVEYISGESYNSWIKKIRKILAFSNSPLQYKNGIWSFENRLEIWNLLAKRIFDDHLDRLQESALKVLGEIDPQFELEPEKRYAAAVYNKIPKYSKTIRQGLAESLALLGSYPNVLINCSPNKGDSVAVLTVRKLLSEFNWRLWGSVQDILPVLAEAAPNEFLKAVEKSIHSNSPFDKLFAEEGKGIAGGNNYMTGLLWALEMLAWNPEYLSQATVLLGELDAHDPGRNWANRPVNSLVNIFLPWKPHTFATFEKRKIAIQTLLRECPETSWKVLVRLLPDSLTMTMGTYKPKFHSFVPNDWREEMTNHEYWEQIDYYAECFVNESTKDFSRLKVLIQEIQKLPLLSFKKAIHVLECITVDSNNTYLLWNELLKVINLNKRHSSEQTKEIKQLEKLAKKLQPINPQQLYSHLFNQRAFDLYEKNGSWEEKSKKLEKRRNNAIKKIFGLSGYDAVKKFAMLVESPHLVGHSFGIIIGNKKEVVDLQNELNIEDNKLQSFLSGYAWIRYQTIGDNWLNQLNIAKWDKAIIAKLLTYLPFQMSIWQVVEKLLGNDEGLYWKIVNLNNYMEENNVYYVIEKLLMYERPLSAIDCLYWLILDKKKLNISIAVKTLLQAVSMSEKNRSIDGYHITQIIKHLQNREDISEDDMFHIEWQYLALLEYHSPHNVFPKFLEKRLATNPAFFCEVIRVVFRSEKEDKQRNISEEQRNIASNAYRLLCNWHTPPGKISDNQFDSNFFNQWLDQVIKTCEESGHLNIALSQIGHVLIYVPADDSLWINTSVAEILNKKNMEKLREGYSIAIYNSRGMHQVDPEAKPEKELAEKYRQYAEQVENKGFQRFAVTLRGIAEGYEREAKNIISRYLE